MVWTRNPFHTCRTHTLSTTTILVKKQASKVTELTRKFEKKVVKKEKLLKTTGEKQKQNDKIRDITLMISKLLFHLSKIGEK